MPDDEILNIQLQAIPGGRKHPVWVNDDNEEELVRDAARQLRQKFTAYQQTFSEAHLSDKELLEMVALDVAVGHVKLERNNDKMSFSTKIHQLNEMLKTYLKEQ